MFGLQGSRWASKPQDDKPEVDRIKDEKTKDESRYVSVPSPGFVLHPVKPKDILAGPPRSTPTKPATASAPKVLAKGSAGTIAPAPEPVKTPTVPPRVLETAGAPPHAAGPEKQLSPAEIAAAKIRARMAEIMGPRRHLAPFSAAKGKGPPAPAKVERKASGDGDKDMSESNGDVDMNLMD